MAQQVIDTTTDHGTYKGDPAKVAFEKVNANDAELYGYFAGLAAVGGDNMLINCGLPINQRDFEGGALAAGAYGYDRWKAGAGGCNITINATTGVFTHISGPLQQVVEAPQLAWGKKLTISVEDPSGPISVSVGGATATIAAGTGRRGVTLTPSGSGNMTVQLTAAGVTYSRPKLERGEFATPFQARDQGFEEFLCQRYAYLYKQEPGNAFTNAVVLNSTTLLAFLNFARPMRAKPSARSVASNVTVTDAGGSRPFVSQSLIPIGANRIAITVQSIGLTPGQSAYLGAQGSGFAVLFDADL